ncbi:MAG TPA: DUF1015 domain-containing protein [Candidatus Dormibacteraeota bacterium]|jgi:uncharacterized protein (DUF1015 family)|nr:DUF1015 domain-containing protein [Candidatus Dormibacteraeota bacterium]
MATVQPFDGTRYNPDHVKLGGVLAPPYDVISDAKRDELYGRDLRNIVRIDSGATFPDDVEGVDDRYTRATSFLASWHDLGVLVRDDQEGFYVVDHSFQHPDGSARNRRGLLATVEATPWESSDLRPHERTLRGPKADRLALLRATRAQTSPVFAVWTGSERIVDALEGVATGHALLGGRLDGEVASEKLLLWRVADPEQVAAIAAALHSAKLYVADGHHRYETAAAYAAERRSADPHAPHGAPFERCLVYLAAADDPGITILPTHRLVRPGHGIAFSLDDLWARLDDAFDTMPAPDGRAALAAASVMHATHHAFAVVAHDGAAVLRRPRHAGGSPRDRLDVAVLETEVLGPAGVSADMISAGALTYTRDPDRLDSAVQGGDAILAFGLSPVTTDEVIAVADAGETMPQKSTYFYPKVPSGLVLFEV